VLVLSPRQRPLLVTDNELEERLHDAIQAGLRALSKTVVALGGDETGHSCTDSCAETFGNARIDVEVDLRRVRVEVEEGREGDEEDGVGWLVPDVVGMVRGEEGVVKGGEGLEVGGAGAGGVDVVG